MSKTFKQSITLIFLILNICNCNKKESKQENDAPTQTLFETIPASQSGLNFVNNIIEDEEINYLHYGYIYNGAGVAVGDINNDGLADLYFSSNLEFNKLYLNLGNLKFKDITESANVDGGQGYKSGVTMVDINQDGWLDIFVCKTAIKDSSFRTKMLYINNGNGTFTEKAKEYGLDDQSYTTQAYFFDSDLDGDLDVYFVNHPMNFEDNNYIKPNILNSHLGKSKNLQYISDRLYENRNGKFFDISLQANILNEAFGLSAVIGDFNQDNLPDIYVANDFLQPDYLYINQGKNKFKEQFSEYFQHCPFSSMGTDYADINNDGCLDLISVDMTPSDNYRQKMLLMTQNYDRYELMIKSELKAQFSINSLQLGSCGHTFSDIAFLTKTAYTDWSWTPLIADFDNDGNKDIFITNGYLHDVMNSDYNRYKLDSLEKLHSSGLISQLQWINEIPSVKTKDYFFKNHGNLLFTDASKEWNSGPATFSHGAVYSDLDNDGDLDIIVSNVNDPVTLLCNNSNKIENNNFIRFSFENIKNKTNEGAEIKLILSDGSIQIQKFNQTRGFLSKVEDVLHFGIPNKSTVTSVEINWPDHHQIILSQPEINKNYKISYVQSKIISTPRKVEPYFTDISKQLPINFKHQENNFIDFKREPLLIRKLSEEGPAVAVGDVNGDQLDDIYIGGASTFAGQLYIQGVNGQYQLSKNNFDEDKNSEDAAACFIDINGDHLLDLYVVSGGNEFEVSSKEYQDRLYINQGNSVFKKAVNLVPTETNSGSCVTYTDIDGDGDSDLFIGSRSIPGKYPQKPEH
ncbi:MAG: FG-GAP-like repeat-containing protein, partial [Saprospiraceae bacterium]